MPILNFVIRPFTLAILFRVYKERYRFGCVPAPSVFDESKAHMSPYEHIYSAVHQCVPYSNVPSPFDSKMPPPSDKVHCVLLGEFDTG
ncbi:hypothetical protein L798_07574 [Zootermopsis nevadensis]|uniref:Uncharacterized protein n=1 Tax=Zootermopsis nevadensis TaxID=136037 RepID=A0A067QRY6_ZOONE|nr:hypothetical protein L798_07574 [Zootermopsis nevadensis]